MTLLEILPKATITSYPRQCVTCMTYLHLYSLLKRSSEAFYDAPTKTN